MGCRQRAAGWSGRSAKGLKLLAWYLYWKATQWGPGPPFGPSVLLPPLPTSAPRCLQPGRPPGLNAHLKPVFAQAVPSARTALSSTLSRNSSVLSHVSTWMSSALWGLPWPSTCPAKSNSWISKTNDKTFQVRFYISQVSPYPCIFLNPLSSS